MKKKTCHPSPNNPVLLKLPAYPIAGRKLFERLGAAITDSFGYPVRMADLARLIGKSESTISHWFGLFDQPHLVSYFSLLEQLTREQRHSFIDKLCRDLPLLDHPRLCHNSLAVGTLSNLAAQERGLTLILGADDDKQTFLLTAFGHSARRLDVRHRRPAGLDLHEPHRFVPVEGVQYLRDSGSVDERASAVRAAWPGIRKSQSPLILLNRLGPFTREFRDDIISLAATKHVILADQHFALPSKRELPSIQPIHILSVSTTTEAAGWITVEIRRL